VVNLIYILKLIQLGVLCTKYPVILDFQALEFVKHIPITILILVSTEVLFGVCGYVKNLLLCNILHACLQ
jgi:hypothetical protein